MPLFQRSPCMLASDSCGCGGMHVGKWRTAQHGEKTGRRNVCGADCGNVISRYVAVGRPSSSRHRHLPTYDLSYPPFVEERESGLSSTCRPRKSVEPDKSPEFLSFFSAFLFSAAYVRFDRAGTNLGNKILTLEICGAIFRLGLQPRTIEILAFT